jgi:hypothetical protein
LILFATKITREQACPHPRLNPLRALTTWSAGLCLLGITFNCAAIDRLRYVEYARSTGSFALVEGSNAASILVDTADYAGVLRAVTNLQSDIARVTAVTPVVRNEAIGAVPNLVIIGTIGKSRFINELARAGKIDVSPITGKWESFVIQTVTNPLPGVASALVIAGSDKRGTIFGVYDLCEEMGVSPWHWWADSVPEHRDALFVKAGRYTQGSPSVKYRGIFLNDEAPDLTNWVREKYGNVAGLPNVANYGHEFYARIFELILRLKGNFLWPAMWNNAFNEDDPENPRLADEFGIVMGTSHQEPMLRAQKEWDRGPGRQQGNWNYNRVEQQPVLQQFWRDGIRRNKSFESIITLGLRAENDSGAPIGAELTGQVVAAQRKILAGEINPDLTQVPQLWCLYKEVQNYYEQGLRVPDDVTLLWAEDNWGNVRRLPTAEERKRPGGAGIYYHFDYHGGPRSYQWLNTSPLAKIQDQMSLARQFGADRIWIVNVGHFKGYELPMEYFISLGWNADAWTRENIQEFTRLWAEREFGPAHASEIAGILSRYTKYNARRKPESLSPTTYSLVNYREAERVVADYQAIAAKAEEIKSQLPAAKRDAFYQLVLFPAKACALLNELYFTAGRNALYAKQGRASAIDLAARTRELFQADTNLTYHYNNQFADGRWSHFMDQSHLGYTSWQDPPRNSLNAIRLVEREVPEAAAMGVAVEGSENTWPGADSEPVLPQFDAFGRERCYLEFFNKGKTPFEFAAIASEPWISLSDSKGSVGKDQRIWVTVDFNQAPKGKSSGSVKISGAGTVVTVKVESFNPTNVTQANLRGFVESDRVVSIEPEHFARNADSGSNRWIRIEDYGRTLSGMRATGPVDAPAATPTKDSPCLEYQMYLFSTGEAEVTVITSPMLNFMPGRAIRYAVSFDDHEPQTVTLVPANYSAQNGNRDWETSVLDNARYGRSKHTIAAAGYHTMKIWMVDHGVVVQKLIVDLGGLKPSYLGPPESFFGVVPK